MIATVRYFRWIGALLVLALLLTACGAETPTNTPIPTPAPAPPTDTAAAAPATATTAGAPATATSGSSGPATGEPIKIGAVVPTTGRYAAGGTLIKNAYQLAVEDINGAGGVDVGGTKRPLDLTILDDESDATKTVQRLETLNSSNQVAAYLGGFGSDLHAAAAAIAEKNKVPYIGVAFALKKIHEQGYQYLFSPFPKSPDIAKATFDLLDSLSPKPAKVAIFAETTDWGAELGGLWRTEAEARGYQVVTAEQYTPGAKDFTPLITKARDSGAEVVLALPNPPDGTTITKQMKELAYTPAATFLIRAPDSATWATNLGKDGDDVLLIQGWADNVTFPGSQEMVARYKAKYNAVAQSSVGSAYAAVQVLADAISRAKSTDHQAIRDAIAATDMQTVIGPVKFNADGTGQVISIVTQYQNGVQVAVWPKDQAAAAPLYPAKPFADR
jgi:branched-chain amino acid transport system substrate-binding protein